MKVPPCISRINRGVRCAVRPTILRPSNIVLDTVSIASLTISNSHRKVLLIITPNSYPGTRLTAKRDVGDDMPIDFVQVRFIFSNSLLYEADLVNIRIPSPLPLL